MKCSTRTIKKAFENATPNVLGSILADCGAKDSQPPSVVPVKKPSRFLNFAASAAALLLLAGIGAGIASIVVAGRTQYATVPTEDTTAPTTAEELDGLNKDIIRAFCEFKRKDLAQIGSTLSVRHYWNADGSYIFYIDGLQDYEDEITHFSLMSKEFLFPTTQVFYAYKDGYCYEADQALYQSAFISYEQFLELYEYHKSQNADLYDPANWPAKSELNCPALLTSEKRIAIEQAFGWDYLYTDDLWYSKSHGGLRYYGSDNGYDILFQNGMTMAEEIQAIAGQAFGHVNGFILYAHKDGELIPLKDAYNTGLVSKEAIKLAREYHNQCTSEQMISTCRPEPTKRGYEQYVEEAWAKISDEPFGTWYSEDNPNGDWRFYVDYILFYCGGEQEEVFTTIEIAGSTFSHPTTFKLYKMHFGEMGVELTELTEEEETYYLKRMAAEAAEQHVRCQKAAFGENWPLGSQTSAQDGTVPEGFAIEMGLSIVQNDTNMERKDIVLDSCQIINDPQGNYYRLTLLSDESVYTVDVRINGGELLNVSINDRPPDPNALSQEEFDEISELLTTHGSWMNMALIQPYTNSEEITIWTLFFNGFPDESREPTDLEREFLSEDPFFDFNQIFIRVPLDRIDGILQKYFGITLEDTDQVELESIMDHYYLEETNCYYLCIPEYAYADVEITKGLHRDDGTIAVYYEYFDGYYYSTRRVILKPTEDGYHILSNIPETWEEYEE